MSRFNKSQCTCYFNIIFRNTMNYFRNVYHNNIGVITEIDIGLNNAKGNNNRKIIELYVKHICEDEKLERSIKKKTPKYFETLDDGNNPLFKKLRILYDNANSKDITYLMDQLNNMRKWANKYDDVME